MYFLLLLLLVVLGLIAILLVSNKPVKPDWSHLPTNYRSKEERDPYSKTFYK